jgi:hypothetical protein
MRPNRCVVPWPPRPCSRASRQPSDARADVELCSGAGLPVTGGLLHPYVARKPRLDDYGKHTRAEACCRRCGRHCDNWRRNYPSGTDVGIYDVGDFARDCLGCQQPRPLSPEGYGHAGLLHLLANTWHVGISVSSQLQDRLGTAVARCEQRCASTLQKTSE